MSRVALTGTPGVGKSTLAALLKAEGRTVLEVGAMARQAGCIVAHDDSDDSDVVDIDALRRHVPAPPDRRDQRGLLIEGHLSHLLGLEETWVVRCDPRVLRLRLEARGYAKAKVLENLEAEALDIILQEALDQPGRVVQRDGTRRTAEELASTFVEAHAGSSKSNDLEAVDWSHQLPFR